MIDRYLAELRAGLAFDHDLRERVCEEVEAHLEDALANADTGADTERRVLERFGKPSEMGRLFAELVFGQRLQSTWQRAAWAILAVFLAMRIRNTTIPAPLPGNDHFYTFAITMDRFAFFIAVAACACGWLALRQPEMFARARNAITPIVASAFALAISAICGLALTYGMVSTSGLTARACAVLAALSLEFIIIGLLTAQLFTLNRHIGFLDRNL